MSAGASMLENSGEFRIQIEEPPSESGAHDSGTRGEEPSLSATPPWRDAMKFVIQSLLVIIGMDNNEIKSKRLLAEHPVAVGCFLVSYSVYCLMSRRTSQQNNARYFRWLICTTKVAAFVSASSLLSILVIPGRFWYAPLVIGTPPVLMALLWLHFSMIYQRVRAGVAYTKIRALRFWPGGSEVARLPV